jgi:hypothetical protein
MVLPRATAPAGEQTRDPTERQSYLLHVILAGVVVPLPTAVLTEQSSMFHWNVTFRRKSKLTNYTCLWPVRLHSAWVML